LLLPQRTRPPFAGPLLGIWIDGQLEKFDKSYFRDAEWRPADCDPTLTRIEFPTEDAPGQEAVVVVGESGKVEFRFVQRLHAKLTLLVGERGWRVASLVNWLDRQIRHPDIARGIAPASSTRSGLSANSTPRSPACEASWASASSDTFSSRRAGLSPIALALGRRQPHPDCAATGGAHCQTHPQEPPAES